MWRTDDLVFDEDWRRGILRIWIGDAPIGTAFCIAPRLALTCHHCLRDVSGPVTLRAASVREEGPLLPVNEWCFSVSPTGLDAALIRLGEDAPGHLPLSTLTPRGFGKLVAYGYPGTDPRQALVRIDLEPRGRKSFTYSPDYTLPDTLALSGDPAAPGMSGGPVFDTTAGVAIAMIVGGPDYNDRAIALPLWALAKVGADFPAFQIACLSNWRNTIQAGWAMNEMRARQLCTYQTDAAVKKLGPRYDRARTVRRDKLMAAAARFVNSSSSAFAIVSEPNCGKTLASVYAATEFSRRSLFLEAFLINDVRRSLTDYLQASLEKAPDLAPDENVGALASVLSKGKTPLVVFVDGVNEIDDDVSKAERWIAEAIENAEYIGAKLIVSCRSDFWKGLEAVHGQFETYDLGGFSPAEAKAAGLLYGIDERIADDLDRHPLMFKIASELGLESASVTRDRRSALLAMIRRTIKLSPGVRDLDRTFSACERIVRDLDEHADSIPWDLAANHLGGSAIVDNLVEGGLFRRREQETIRFTFDQMLEAMRPPLPSDEATLAQLWTDALQDERAAKRAAGEFTRAAFASQQEISSRHAEALVNALEAHLRKKVAPTVLKRRGLESIANIIDSLYFDLPESHAATAEQLTKQIFALVVESMRRGIGEIDSAPGLSSSIARLGIPPAWKFELLCDLLPLCSDYLLREKDLFDRGECHRLIEAAEKVDSVAGVLLRLTTDHAAVIRRLALSKLDDKRRLGERGEATVGSVIAAILRLSAHVDFDDLISLLLDATNSNAANSLLYRVSSDHPVETLAYSIAALSTPRAVAIMETAIEPSLRRLGAGKAPPALLEELLQILRTGTPETRCKAATLVRIADPDNLEAWDELASQCTAISQHARLYPVPATRAGAFLNVLRARADAFAVEQMRDYNGDDRVEAGMAQLALDMWDTKARLAKDLARLAEHKLYFMERSETYAPWRELGHRVVAHSDPEISRQLIYFASPRSAMTESRLQIWKAILSGPSGIELAEEAFGLIAEQHFDSDEAAMKYLKPMADLDGRALMLALSSWIKGKADVFEFFGESAEDELDRERLNHLLSLLVSAIAANDPNLSNELEALAREAQDWVAVFKGFATD